MTRSMTRLTRLGATLSTLSTLSTTSVSAQSADAALQRAASSYRSWTTFQADFIQTIINPMLGAPEVSRGRVFLAPPNRFAMRFTDPAGDRIVADGVWLWIYAPSSVEGQVIKRPVPAAGPVGPNLVGQFVDRPLERYAATYVKRDMVMDRPVDVVRLVPKDPDASGFKEAEIAVDRDDGLLRRLGLIELSGQRRDIVFQTIRTDAPIPARELRFDIPHGVRVVTP